MIREILVSQIEANPNGGDKGGNHVFMARAVALLGALTPALVWMRDHKGVPIDIESIRFATELQQHRLARYRQAMFRRRDTCHRRGDPDIPVGKDIEEALLYPLLLLPRRDRRLRSRRSPTTSRNPTSRPSSTPSW